MVQCGRGAVLGIPSLSETTNETTRILLIEDDAAVAESLKRALERTGYDVAWRPTGAEGVDFAKAISPHLVILDVELPDGSGFDVCRELRLAQIRQPVLMLTVRSDEADKVLGLEVGADDYLTKPYSLSELLARVRALLRRAYGELSTTGGNMVYAKDLVIDRQSAQVRRGDELVNLTPIEFRLLVYMAEHPQQVLSRTQILEAVWGYDADVADERTVNVHIRRLREKVEVSPGEPSLILTVPGAGYRLSA